METVSALLALCAGNWPVTGELLSQRPVTRNFDVFSNLRPNKWGWVNNKDAGDLRRHSTHYDVTVVCWHFTGENFTETTVDIAHYGVFQNTYLKILLHLPRDSFYCQNRHRLWENRGCTTRFAVITERLKNLMCILHIYMYILCVHRFV